MRLLAAVTVGKVEVAFVEFVAFVRVGMSVATGTDVTEVSVGTMEEEELSVGREVATDEASTGTTVGMMVLAALSVGCVVPVELSTESEVAVALGVETALPESAGVVTAVVPVKVVLAELAREDTNELRLESSWLLSVLAGTKEEPTLDIDVRTVDEIVDEVLLDDEVVEVLLGMVDELVVLDEVVAVVFAVL